MTGKWTERWRETVIARQMEIDRKVDGEVNVEKETDETDRLILRQKGEHRQIDR